MICITSIQVTPTHAYPSIKSLTASAPIYHSIITVYISKPLPTHPHRTPRIPTPFNHNANPLPALPTIIHPTPHSQPRPRPRPPSRKKRPLHPPLGHRPLRQIPLGPIHRPNPLLRNPLPPNKHRNRLEIHNRTNRRYHALRGSSRGSQTGQFGGCI